MFPTVFPGFLFKTSSSLLFAVSTTEFPSSSLNTSNCFVYSAKDVSCSERLPPSVCIFCSCDCASSTHFLYCESRSVAKAVFFSTYSSTFNVSVVFSSLFNSGISTNCTKSCDCILSMASLSFKSLFITVAAPS